MCKNDIDHYVPSYTTPIKGTRSGCSVPNHTVLYCYVLTHSVETWANKSALKSLWRALISHRLTVCDSVSLLSGGPTRGTSSGQEGGSRGSCDMNERSDWRSWCGQSPPHKHDEAEAGQTAGAGTGQDYISMRTETFQDIPIFIYIFKIYFRIFF